MPICLCPHIPHIPKSFGSHLFCVNIRAAHSHMHTQLNSNTHYSRTPLIRPPSESHWCGRIRGMVAREGFVYEQNAQSVTRNVVVWEGWSLVRVVVRQGFYCNNQYIFDLIWFYKTIFSLFFFFFFDLWPLNFFLICDNKSSSALHRTFRDDLLCIPCPIFLQICFESVTRYRQVSMGVWSHLRHWSGCSSIENH